MEKNRTIDLVAPIIVFFVLLFLYTKFAGPIPFAVNNVNTNKESLFQAAGVGKSSAAPDQARISIGVTESSSSVLDAQNKVNQKTENIINALEKLGLDKKDIKTTSYYVNPDYSFGTSQRITGYSVSQNLEVKPNISKVNEAVDLATSNGANLIGSIEFSLSDALLEKVQNEAREEAVSNAKKKAESLAKAAGIKLGKIIDVNESGGEVPRPVFLEAAKLTDQSESSNPTNITPGENNIEVTITLSYQTN